MREEPYVYESALARWCAISLLCLSAWGACALIVWVLA